MIHLQLASRQDDPQVETMHGRFNGENRFKRLRYLSAYVLLSFRRAALVLPRSSMSASLGKRKERDEAGAVKQHGCVPSQ